MVLRVPSYYKEFHCIADQCQDSCCIGWEIDIDEDTYFYYQSVEGKFGERLRTHMVTEEGNSFALEENGWCPFLNEKKLCDICMFLGEEALCEVCTEFPRFTMEYEDVREKVLSLSCEEVGRILFSSDAKTTWEEREIPEECEAWEAEGTEESGQFLGAADGESAETEADRLENAVSGDEEEEALPEIPAARLEAVREQAVRILQNRSKPVFGRAAEYLAYCDRMQRELYGGEADMDGAEARDDGEADFFAWCGQGTDGLGHIDIGSEEERSGCALTDQESAGREQEERAQQQAYQDFLARMESFGRLEVLYETWTNVKKVLYETFSGENYLRYRQEFLETVRDREYEYEHLLVYFTFRYFMRAYYDDNIRTKAQFAVASVLMIRDMDVLRYVQNGGRFELCDRIDTARIYSKEVEHSEENMELLAEDFQFEDVFGVERMRGQL